MVLGLLVPNMEALCFAESVVPKLHQCCRKAMLRTGAEKPHSGPFSCTNRSTTSQESWLIHCVGAEVARNHLGGKNLLYFLWCLTVLCFAPASFPLVSISFEVGVYTRKLFWKHSLPPEGCCEKWSDTQFIKPVQGSGSSSQPCVKSGDHGRGWQYFVSQDKSRGVPASCCLSSASQPQQQNHSSERRLGRLEHPSPPEGPRDEPETWGIVTSGFSLCWLNWIITSRMKLLTTTSLTAPEDERSCHYPACSAQTQSAPRSACSSSIPTFSIYICHSRFYDGIKSLNSQLKYFPLGLNYPTGAI